MENLKALRMIQSYHFLERTQSVCLKMGPPIPSKNWELGDEWETSEKEMLGARNLSNLSNINLAHLESGPLKCRATR